MDKPWYMYPITVPFGDPHYDTLYGGSHDMDIGAPPNTPVTNLLAGRVASLTKPSWGWQVGIQLDSPYNGNAFAHFLHLSAYNPALHVGSTINVGDLIGWVGGANNESQYVGTTNPTGSNYVNPLSQSSQIQVGFALSHGPEYGVGEGWTAAPDPTRNPTQIILDARTRYMNAQQPKLPAGANDNGTAISFSNGLQMVHGFRRKYLEMCTSGLVPSDDEALENEHGSSPVEESNPAYWGSGGTSQTTRYFRLAWSATKGVLVTYLGQEYLYVLAEKNKLQARLNALPSLQQTKDDGQKFLEDIQALLSHL